MKNLFSLISGLCLLVTLLTGCNKDENIQENNKKPFLIKYESGSYVLNTENPKIRLRIVSGNGDYKVSGEVLDEKDIEFEDLFEVTFKEDHLGEYCEIRLINPDWSDTWRTEIQITDKSGQKESLSLTGTNPINWV